ncbi:MAG TPA: hypothetical protein VGX23_09450 [Actinocrinis sp.]|nr:hypothetical protein [Actinocrinis sp.]
MGPAGAGSGPGPELESEPELYPDVVADDGLAAAMKRIAAASGLTLGEVEDVHYPHLPGIRFGATVPGRERLTVEALMIERRFLVDNTMTGVAHARGYTSDLADVVRAAAAWHAGADPRGMQAVAAFIDLPLVAEARATGSAELVVEAVWQSRMMFSRRLMERHSDGRRERTAVRSRRSSWSNPAPTCRRSSTRRTAGSAS